MAFDEQLAMRIRRYFADDVRVTEKKMFGGLCFMLSGHMCCGIVKDTLMARVGPDQYEHCLALPDAREMDFTGKPMKGMLYIDPEGITAEPQLSSWLDHCKAFVQTLPPK